MALKLSLSLQLPDESIIVQYEEPMVMSTIITPDEYISSIMALIMVCQKLYFTLVRLQSFENLVMIFIFSQFLKRPNVLLQDRRGEQLDQSYIDNKRVMFKVIFPLNEIVIDFFDVLKSKTSGYAR